MPFRRVLPKIFLLIGFLTLFIIIKYRVEIKEFFSFNLQKAKIHTDNFFYQSGSGAKRRKPVTFLQRETELALYIGEPFRNFNRRDWEEFWDVIYGAYVTDAPQEEGLPRRVRQMEREELSYELARLYPQPLAYFTQEQWQAFFSIIFKKNEP
ncbi:MAG: hypothetical protein V1925_02475 [Candidatus Omnitrophota bacterium]